VRRSASDHSGRPASACGRAPKPALLPLPFLAARSAGLDVLLDGVLGIGRDFAIKVKRNRFDYCIAIHTKSPKTTRIF